MALSETRKVQFARQQAIRIAGTQKGLSEDEVKLVLILGQHGLKFNTTIQGKLTFIFPGPLNEETTKAITIPLNVLTEKHNAEWETVVLNGTTYILIDRL